MSKDLQNFGSSVAVTPVAGRESTRRWRLFWVGVAVLILAASPLVFSWARFAWADDLASYVLLIPFISGYLLATQRRPDSPVPGGSILSGTIAGISAAVFAVLAWIQFGLRGKAVYYDYLGPAVLALLLAGLSWALFTLGGRVVRRHAFAIAFLVFAAPLPSWAVNGLEIFFQQTSAEVASWLIHLSGMPMLRSGLVLQLPGITLQVAQECSGIRSSLVLFIVSILAGHLLLARAGGRLALALFVIPLGIVRNGFRILTIAWLCVNVDPRMIDSPIHHRGGPIFFALSLIPLFLFLLWLRRNERRRVLGRHGTESLSPGKGPA